MLPASVIKRFAVPWLMFIVPATFPVPVDAKVILSLVVPPMLMVTPELTVSVLVIVTVLPDVAASRSHVPVIVSAPRLIVGTAVMLLEAAPMTTESPVAGAPLGDQLPAVVQVPPVARFHVFVAPNAPAASTNTASALTTVKNSNFFMI
jgi:hypothetical protein